MPHCTMLPAPKLLPLVSGTWLSMLVSWCLCTSNLFFAFPLSRPTIQKCSLMLCLGVHPISIHSPYSYTSHTLSWQPNDNSCFCRSMKDTVLYMSRKGDNEQESQIWNIISCRTISNEMQDNSINPLRYSI